MHSESILSSFSKQPPMCAAEAVERISEMTGIKRSEQQVRAFMKRHALKFIKCGHIPAKADNEVQQQWVEENLKPVIEAAQQGQVHLFFCDAAHFVGNGVKKTRGPVKSYQPASSLKKPAGMVCWTSCYRALLKNQPWEKNYCSGKLFHGDHF